MTITNFVLPVVFSQNYTDLALKSRASGISDNDFLKYFSSAGFRLGVDTDGRVFRSDPLLYYAINTADITFKPGHLLVRRLSPNSEVISEIERQRQGVLAGFRLINHTVVPTPFLGYNIGSVFSENEDWNKRTIFSLCEYLKSYVIGVIQSLPKSQKITSISIKPHVLLEIDGEPFVDLISMGSGILYDFVKDGRAFDGESDSRDTNLYIVPRVNSFVDFLSKFGKTINQPGFFNEILDGDLKNMDSIREKINKLKTETKVVLTSETTEDIFGGALIPIAAGFVDNQEVSGNNNNDFHENWLQTVYNIESSHDFSNILSVMSWAAVSEQKRRAISGKSVGQISIKTIPQFSFVLNLTHDVVASRETGKQIDQFIRKPHRFQTLVSLGKTIPSTFVGADSARNLINNLAR